MRLVAMLLVGIFFIAACHCYKLSPSTNYEYYSQDSGSKYQGAVVHESPVKINPFQLLDGTDYYSYQKGITTLYESFEDSCNKHGNEQYLGTLVGKDDQKVYKWITYNEAKRFVKNIATSLYHQDGIRKGGKVGIFFINRTEWVLLDHACSSMSAITVPIGFDEPEKSILHICNDVQLEIIFTSKENMPKLEPLFVKLPHLRKVVVVGEEEEFSGSWKYCSTKDESNTEWEVSIVSFATYTEDNNLSTDCLERPTISTWFTICYTSGTTGPPKGVVHTHGNFMAELASMFLLSDLGRIFKFNSEIVHFSYLPLHHIFERMVMLGLTIAGGKAGFYGGDTRQLSSDAKILRPTIFVAVPRILSKMYSIVMDSVNKKPLHKRLLFKATLLYRIYLYRHGAVKKNAPEKNVFAKITDRFGGRIQVIVSGGAPLKKKYIEFYQAVFENCIQGYGQTETCGAVASVSLNDPSAGHVGGIIPGVQITFLLPEKEEHRNGDMELCLKGPIISPGYYNKNNSITSLCNSDGWYRTGDAAEILPNGALHIIGRLGDTIKLNKGNYVNLAEIATVLELSQLYSQICVTAESTFDYTIAVVVPVETLTNEEEFIQKVLAEFNSPENKEYREKLSSDNLPRGIVIAKQPFTVESGELTGSQKIKRKTIGENYKAEILKAHEKVIQGEAAKRAEKEKKTEKAKKNEKSKQTEKAKNTQNTEKIVKVRV